MKADIINHSLDIKATLLKTVLEIWENFLGHLPLIVSALIIIFFTTILSKIVKKIVVNSLRRKRIKNSLKQLSLRFSAITVWIIGLLIAATIVFPDLTPSKVLGGLGIVSIAIGFAFKDIFENFFAGIIVLWRFPFEDGDFIEIEGITGEVIKISVRITILKQPNDELIIIPNSMLVKNPVKILTHQGMRRFSAIASIAYHEDVKKSCKIIEKCLKKCKLVSKEHELQIFPKEFNSSSVDIEVSWWGESTPYGDRESRGQVIGAIKEAFDKEGIEIPFPYRTLVFKDALKIKKV